MTPPIFIAVLHLRGVIIIVNFFRKLSLVKSSLVLSSRQHYFIDDYIGIRCFNQVVIVKSLIYIVRRLEDLIFPFRIKIPGPILRAYYWHALRACQRKSRAYPLTAKTHTLNPVDVGLLGMVPISEALQLRPRRHVFQGSKRWKQVGGLQVGPSYQRV